MQRHQMYFAMIIGTLGLLFVSRYAGHECPTVILVTPYPTPTTLPPPTAPPTLPPTSPPSSSPPATPPPTSPPSSSPPATPPPTSPPVRSGHVAGTDTCCAKILLPYFQANKSVPGGPNTPPPSEISKEYNGLRLTLSSTKPHMCIMHANPDYDSDLSKSVSKKGITEANIMLLYRKVLQPCCADGKGVVIDVGGNYGLHALYSAAMGCTVHTFEPMEEFLTALKTGSEVNCLTDLVHIHRMVLTNETKLMKMTSIRQRTAGVFLGMTALQGFGMGTTGQPTVDVPGDLLDKVMLPLIKPEQRVCLLKADVEGHEPEVIEGAEEFLMKYKPRAVVLEHSPGMRPVKDDPKTAKMLESVAKKGYIPYDNHWGVAGMLPADWDTSPLLVRPVLPIPGTTDFRNYTRTVAVNNVVFFFREDTNSTILMRLHA